MSDFYRVRDGGLDLFVRLTPKTSVEEIDGIETAADGRAYLAARVRAIPAKGAANTALERLVAERLEVPRSKVAVIAGHTAGLKTVRVEAASPSVLAALAGFQVLE